MTGSSNKLPTDAPSYGSADNVTLTMPIPSDSTQDFAAELLAKKPNQNILCKGFLETVKRCLDSEFAATNTATVALPSVFNTVASTFPDVFSSSRLQATSGGGIFLFTSMMTAVLLKKAFKGEQYHRVVDDLIKNAPLFAFNFNVAYMAGADIAAKILADKTVSTNDPGVITGISLLLAVSFAYGVTICYGQGREQTSAFFKATNKISFALTVGNLLRDCIRAYNFSPSTEEESSTAQQALSYAPLILSAMMAISTICASINPSLPRRIAALNAAIYQCGTVFESFDYDQARVLSLVDVGARAVVGAGLCVVSCRPKQYELITQHLRITEDPEKGQEDEKHASPKSTP